MRPLASPSSTTAAGTPSVAVAASPAASGARRIRATTTWITVAATTSTTASATSSPRTSRRAPSVTKNSGMKKPCAMPRTCRVRRRGSPTAATTRPVAKPATRIDVEDRSAT